MSNNTRELISRQMDEGRNVDWFIDKAVQLFVFLGGVSAIIFIIGIFVFITKEGMGFIVTMRLFDASRPGIGAQAVGLAQGALEASIAYAKERVQFGHPIISLQAVQHMLADMAIQVEAARALVYAAARTVDSGAKNIGGESAMAKVFASDIAMKVTTDAMQIFGGVGYMRDYPIEKMFRDAKITQIYEGTNQVLRNVIALELRKRRARRE